MSTLPLCVDLDGTLVRVDTSWVAFFRLAREAPWLLPLVAFWLLRGRAFMKRKLAERFAPDPAALPYNEPLLAYLKEQKQAGRRLALATGTDIRTAVNVANHVRIFDDVFASDGTTNLTGERKADLLVRKYGEKGFVYAGNSRADRAVWARAAGSILAGPGRGLEAVRAAAELSFP